MAIATNFLGADPSQPRQFASVIFTTYVFFQVFNLFNAHSLHIIRLPFAGLTLGSSFLNVLDLMVVVQVLLTTFGGEIFSTESLSLVMWLKIILLTSTALIFGEIARQMRLSRRLRLPSNPFDAAALLDSGFAPNIVEIEPGRSVSFSWTISFPGTEP